MCSVLSADKTLHTINEEVVKSLQVIINHLIGQWANELLMSSWMYFAEVS